MASNLPEPSRFSLETESTLKDIWQYSQQTAQAQLNPAAMEAEIETRRQIRKEVGLGDRLSFGTHMDSSLGIDAHPRRTTRNKNLDLSRSIQLLDDAVGTPKLLRRTPLQYSNYARTPLPIESEYDVSVSLGLTPGRSLLATPGNTMTTFDESSRSFSKVGKDQTQMLSQMELEETNVALLLEEDPALTACTDMFGQFQRSLMQNGAKHQVFDLLAEYEKVCSSSVTVLKKLVRGTVPGQAKFAKTVEMLRLLEQETYTWRLICSLYKDRLMTEAATMGIEPMAVDKQGEESFRSGKQLVETLYEKDPVIRQGQMVVDWLEKNAEEKLEDYYDKVEFFTDKTGAWENTLHALRQTTTGNTLGSERLIVTEMDPDAPVRQKRPLADLDIEDESRLLRYLFVCIRAGQLEEAQKLCTKLGQSWRAATLEGWKLYHDPNYSQLGPGGQIKPVEGNPNRDIWKSVCWRMAEEEHFSLYERAIYAALSGNLKQLISSCDSWEDYLWAYVRTMVDLRVEHEIRSSSVLIRPWQEMPASYWDQRLSLESVFQELQASNKKEVKDACKDRYHTIQKYIILGDTEGLMEEIFDWCKDEINRPPQHLLRFMAHLMLFFRSIDVHTRKDEYCVVILESYVRYLIEDKHISLIATYVSTLPQDLQVDWYAKFLEDVTETDERKHCLALAEEVGLDVQNIAKIVVENIRSRDTTSFQPEGELPLECTTNPEDIQKIKAIEWLVFNPAQRAEALRQANAILRTFLAKRKLPAARQVLSKIPSGSIDTIIKYCQLQTGGTELSAEDDNAVREFLCVQAYLDAHDSFNDWFEHYHNAKPAQPEVMVGASFTERVAHEQKTKQFEAEYERWEHSLMLQTKTTVKKMYNVLLFVDGGWMVDRRTDGPKDLNRSHQLRLLRQLCLPSLCFLLHRVLHSTGQYQECTQLADLIASELYHLYKVFHRDELQKLLEMLRESSVELSTRNVDALGYRLS